VATQAPENGVAWDDASKGCTNYGADGVHFELPDLDALRTLIPPAGDNNSCPATAPIVNPDDPDECQTSDTDSGVTRTDDDCGQWTDVCNGCAPNANGYWWPAFSGQYVGIYWTSTNQEDEHNNCKIMNGYYWVVDFGTGKVRTTDEGNYAYVCVEKSAN
jgi:hypothetical protein